jgi:adenylate cyclase
MASVRFRPSGGEVHVDVGTTLHAAVLRAGLPIASACGADGLCARCGLDVIAGSERLSPELPDEQRAKQRNRIEPHLRLACQTRVEGDVEVTAAYW